MTVHIHGPEEGAGLSCNEIRLPDGSLIGACQIERPRRPLQFDEYDRYVYLRED